MKAVEDLTQIILPSELKELKGRNMRGKMKALAISHFLHCVQSQDELGLC